MRRPPPAKKAIFRGILKGMPGSDANRQRQRLGEALKLLGSISTFEAMRYLGIYDPRPRKFELVHKHGWKIATVTQFEETETGSTHRVGLYVLQKAGSTTI